MINNEDVLMRNPLSVEETEFLIRGFGEWSGPARCTNILAQAIGFESKLDMFDSYEMFSREILESGNLMASDWIRLLLAVEIVFASDVVGSGHDWKYTTGWSDADSIKMLRSIQRKILRAVPSAFRRGVIAD